MVIVFDCKIASAVVFFIILILQLMIRNAVNGVIVLTLYKPHWIPSSALTSSSLPSSSSSSLGSWGQLFRTRAFKSGFL